MTNDEFIHWIEGYITLTPDTCFNKTQYRIVKNHVNLVKAMTDHLEPNILLFISTLENLFIKADAIPINEFKEVAKIIV